MREPCLHKDFACVCQKERKIKILSSRRKERAILTTNNILQYAIHLKKLTVLFHTLLKIKFNVDIHFSDLLGRYRIDFLFGRVEVVAVNGMIIVSLS